MEWLAKLAYMTDTFSLLNELNLSLPGFLYTFTLRNKMDTFKTKLALWDTRVQEEDIETCPLLGAFLTAAVNQKVTANISTFKGFS